MKKVMIAILALTSASAFAKDYHCEAHSTDYSGCIKRSYELTMDPQDHKQITVDEIKGRLDPRAVLNGEHLNYLQYSKFKTDLFETILLSPQLLTGQDSGTFKAGFHVDEEHAQYPGQMVYYGYTCTVK